MFLFLKWWLNARFCNLLAFNVLSCFIFFPKELQVNKDTSFKFCYPFPDEWGNSYAKAVVLAKFLVYYAIPLVIIGIFYIMIAIHLAFGARVPGEMQGAIRQVSLWTVCVCMCNVYGSYLFFCVVYFYVCDFVPACVGDDGVSFYFNENKFCLIE